MIVYRVPIVQTQQKKNLPILIYVFNLLGGYYSGIHFLGIIIDVLQVW